MGIFDTCAAELRALADEARRLPPPSARNPHAFHEAREELAQRMIDLAHVLAGNIAIGRPRKEPIREGRSVSRSGKVVKVEFRNKKRV